MCMKPWDESPEQGKIGVVILALKGLEDQQVEVTVCYLKNSRPAGLHENLVSKMHKKIEQIAPIET